jgi:hypothetical protein
MINGEFVNDLTGLLHDVTTSGKTQTFYDVDAKIATMGLTICKNFKEGPVFWNFFQGRVRQSDRRLSKAFRLTGKTRMCGAKQ